MFFSYLINNPLYNFLHWLFVSTIKSQCSGSYRIFCIFAFCCKMRAANFLYTFGSIGGSFWDISGCGSSGSVLRYRCSKKYFFFVVLPYLNWNKKIYRDRVALARQFLFNNFFENFWKFVQIRLDNFVKIGDDIGREAKRLKMSAKIYRLGLDDFLGLNGRRFTQAIHCLVIIHGSVPKLLRQILF